MNALTSSMAGQDVTQVEEATFACIDAIVNRAPAAWLAAVIGVLRETPAEISESQVLGRLPDTCNPDLANLMKMVLHMAKERMSWEALGVAFAVAARLHSWHREEHHLEMLWSGPIPAGGYSARRIDQALYDLIACAKKDIVLVTFAAARIQLLTGNLLSAIQRGVNIRLILEFAEESLGQLSHDALRAFPMELREQAEIWYWPLEHRDCNAAGKPGKLHAKLAIIDETVLLSSANLTDDAFNRNMELGVMLNNPEFHATITAHIDGLMKGGELRRM